MKQQKRKKAPFVVTIGAFASVSVLACGGSTNDDSTSGGGTAGTGATGATGGGGSGGSTSGGTGGTSVGGSGGTSVGGSAGVGGGATCPANPPTSGFESCTTKGQACEYSIECQSGTMTHTFSCDSLGYWVLGVSPPCDKPYDSCPGTQLYCTPTSGWTMPEGTNPPSPCPADMPAEGATCFSGAFGGVWENCGYACGPTGAGWQVANCPYVDPGDSKWSLGPCQ